MEGISIQLVRSVSDVVEFQAIERQVWEGDDLEIIPAHLLLTHQRYGGILLIARDPAGHGIGVLLGFPGFKGGMTLHCSHILGIVPEWRSRGIGYLMKLRQRELVLAQGLDLIVWTFDPLETRNARLNIGRLGGICREYTPNLYGVMRDGLNAGLETDRLTVEWYIRHPAVQARMTDQTTAATSHDLLEQGVPLATRTKLIADPRSAKPLLYFVDAISGIATPQVLVEAPADFQGIKRLDFGAAHAWRIGMRSVLQDLFARGYAIVDMLVERNDDKRRRCYYLLGSAAEYLAEGRRGSYTG
jgi:predicted GNAT superfamily acetyltransferase